MTINRKLGSVVVAGGLAVGLAGPALADPPAPQMFDGTYTHSGPAIANGPNITTQWIAHFLWRGLRECGGRTRRRSGGL